MQLIKKVFNSYNQKSLNKLIQGHAAKNKILYLTHEWGGGVEEYLHNKISELKNDNLIFVIRYLSKNQKFFLEVVFQNHKKSCYFAELQGVAEFLSTVNFDEIHINQISFFPNLSDIFAFLNSKKTDKTKIIMLVHDFNCICANGHLIKDDGSACEAYEGNCNCKPDALEKLTKWREFLTSKVDGVICFSNNSADIFKNYYPELTDKISIKPHFVPYLRKVNVVKTDQNVNIAVIGFTNKIKGSDLVSKMGEIIISDKAPAKITIIGKFRGKETPAIKVLGKYKRECLPKIVENNQIDIVFVSSICPETFSYVTHEAMMMGLKVACFDLGAQSEYVKKYDRGLIISKMDANVALDEIINFNSI